MAHQGVGIRHVGAKGIADQGRPSEQARRRDEMPTPLPPAEENKSMIISTAYLPETADNLPHQHVPSRNISAGETKRSVMTGTVLQWILVIARPQV